MIVPAGCATVQETIYILSFKESFHHDEKLHVCSNIICYIFSAAPHTNQSTVMFKESRPKIYQENIHENIYQNIL